MFLIVAYSIISSCGEILHIPIGYVKNNTQTDVVGAYWYSDMADSLLCNDRIYLDTYLQPGLSQGIATSPDKGEISKLPDSTKEYIYFFNKDSLDKYQKLHLCNGIVKHCLVKKVVIQLNKVKEPFDTVYINSAKPLN